MKLYLESKNDGDSLSYPKISLMNCTRKIHLLRIYTGISIIKAFV